MSNDPRRMWITGALLAAAAAWPSIVSALTAALASPYERALRTAWCGGPPQDGLLLLGHCPACWAGSAILALTAAIVWAALTPQPAARRR